ncbi:hypothetical protein [Hymenobacter arizonensis]|uniref:Uncharacterized protein n=1 Tax=Hymenobacter arizonensis TaxID=1227077 RepID=A0A1I6BRE9_HYMAR|nr:hypothetical protein [Hymenobacter arizonensis]SFQ83499.1 hypothetical protein SAMN04515668_4982 [Hymenobacter arizonensis]
MLTTFLNSIAGYLTKPLTRDEINQVLQQHFAKSAGAWQDSGSRLISASCLAAPRSALAPCCAAGAIILTPSQGQLPSCAGVLFSVIYN